MEEKKIELKVDNKTITILTGNKMGRTYFKNQVEQELDYDKINIVYFPDQIEDVGSSFIQGIYYFLCENKDEATALQLMKLSSNKEVIKEKVQKSIETYGIKSC